VLVLVVLVVQLASHVAWSTYHVPPIDSQNAWSSGGKKASQLPFVPQQ